MIRAVAKGGCRLLHRLGFWQALLNLERRLGWRRHAVVLLYHHVRGDDGDGDGRPPLSQLEEGVSQSSFAAQLAAFCRWYHPAPAAQLEAALATGGLLDQDQVVVTFDDGYLDNRTLAGPILRRHNAPALIFVATNYIESSRRFWWIEINDLVRHMRDESLPLAAEAVGDDREFAAAFREADLATHDGRRQLRIRLAARLEALVDDQRQAQLARFEEVLGAVAETCLPLLSWDDMRQMLDEGFEFGGHTASHPRLTRLTDQRLRRELDENSRTLAERLRREPRSFAYPHGDVDERVEAAVRTAGFAAAYTADAGVATPGKTSVYRIPRLQPYAAEPAQLAVLIVALKVSKYLPGLMRPVLSRLVGQPFEA